MFEALDAIPVTFGPHEGDVWMIVATLLSFSASLVVGIVAAKNGLTATKISKESTRIAKEASDRDQEYRREEQVRRRHAERYDAAAAMARSFWALDGAIRHNAMFKNSREGDLLAERSNTLKLEALVEIELLHPREHPPEIAAWFVLCHSLLELHDGSFPGDEDSRDNLRGECVGTVRRWKHRIGDVANFFEPKEMINPARPAVG